MKNMAFLILLALAACGSGTTTEQVVVAKPVPGVPLYAQNPIPQKTINGGRQTVRFQQNGASIIADTGTVPLLTRVSFGEDVGLFVHHTNTQKPLEAKSYLAQTGNGYAGLGVSTLNTVFPDVTGYVYESFGSTIPASGSAAYIGDYVAVLDKKFIGAQVEDYLSGGVNLTVDFATGSIQGSIFGRNTRTNGIPSQNVNLSANIADDGSIVGVASGGNLPIDSKGIWSSSEGSFDGQFAGNQAKEIFGAVEIGHSSTTGSTVDEIGVLYLSKQ